MTDEWRVSNGLRLLHFQSSLSEAYLLDFFVENHWEKRLPKCWRSVIDRMPLAVLSNFISVDNDLKQTGSCYPLSLLAFRQCCRQFSLSQKNTEDLNVIQKFVDSAAKCDNQWTSEISSRSLLDKHVKMKKKHELSRIADIFSILLQSVGPLDLVDFGAGQGHLSRLLALRHNVKTFRVEQNEKFLERSAQFDQELREKADFPQPVQIHKKVEIENQGDRCLNNISGPHIAECYAGLHLCGDFSAAIVQDFVRNPKAKALISLGCCYMKLNGGTDRLFFDDYDSNEVKLANNSAVRGYPLSDFVKSVYFSIMAVQLYRYFNFRSLENHQVSYTAREAACHNLHQFEERLKVESDPGHKSHCYRALLEHLIVRQHPACRHLGVRGVKLSEDMTFRSYVDTVKSRLPPAVQADLSEKYLDEMSQEIDMYLSRWDRVIKFYSLRLMLAPVVESILLLDRLIFLKESGLRALLIPIFDSRISPRNLVLLSVKK